MNDATGNGSGNGSSSLTFSELKRRARAVLSRHASRRQGAGGVSPGPGQETHIDILASNNLLQKDSPGSLATNLPPVPVSESPAAPHASVATVLTREDRWRSGGDLKAEVAGRSINSRILEILLPSGERGRAIVKPSEHPKFGFRKPVWVRKDDRGKHWVVVGRYSQWGVRCE